MNFEVTILPGNPKVVEGKSRSTGLPFRIVEQAAHLLLPNGEGAAWMIQPPRDGEPYKPGRYTVDPSSFYVRDGKLAFSPKLIPVTK